MSLFTEPIDRFFVGKLISGLLFAGSFFKLLALALQGLIGAPGLERASGQTFLAYGLSCLLWFGVFRLVEARRQGRVQGARISAI